MLNEEGGKIVRKPTRFLLSVLDARGCGYSLVFFCLLVLGLAITGLARASGPAGAAAGNTVVTPVRASGAAKSPGAKTHSAVVAPVQASGGAKASGTKAPNAVLTALPKSLLLQNSDVLTDDAGFTEAVNAFNGDATTSGCSDSDLDNNHDLARLNPEWKPIHSLNTDLAASQHIFSDEPTILEGTVVPPPNLGPNDQSTSEVSEEDIPWNHFTHDFTIRVTPDARYHNLLSSWTRFQGTTFPLDLINSQSVPDCIAKGGFPDFDKGVCVVPEEKCDDQTTTDRCHHTEMEVEWDNASLMDVSEKEGFQRIWGAVPEFVWPAGRDRVWVMGRWIFDCGHPGVPKAAATREFVKYGTEIHPPRAMVTYRINHPALDSFPRPRVSAPNFPGMQSYLPVTGLPPTLPGGGPTAVPVTEADIYVTGNGGGANDLCMIRATNDDNDCKVPHTLQVEPVNDRNYVFDIYPPGTDYTQTLPNGTFPVAPPVADASLQWRMENHFSELPAHTCGGLDNTSCVTVDPVFCLIDANTPPPTQAETSCPAVTGPPTRLRVILPFAGSSANFFAQSVLLGWDDVPAPGITPPVRTFRVKLHSFTVVKSGIVQPQPPTRIPADWRLFVNVGGQYRYMDPFVDLDADGHPKCSNAALNIAFDGNCFFFDDTPWIVSIQDDPKAKIHVAVGGWRSAGIDDDFCRKFLTNDNYSSSDKCEPFGVDDTVELVFANSSRIGDYEFDLDHDHNYQWVDSQGNPLTSFQTQVTDEGEQYKVEFRVEEVPVNNPPPSSPIQVGTPHFGNFVSSATPIVLSSTSAATEGFQYRSYAAGSPLPVYPFSPPQPYPVHWTHADLPVASQSVAVFLTGADGPNILQYSAESVANLLEPRHTETGLVLDNTPPVVSIVQPQATNYTHNAVLTLNYSANDGAGSGIGLFAPTMDGKTTLPGGVGLQNGQQIRLLKELSLGTHTFIVVANDNVNNAGAASVTFNIIVTPQSIKDDVRQFFQDGAIKNFGLEVSLLAILDEAGEAQTQHKCSLAAILYRVFIDRVQDNRGRRFGIDAAAADTMIADAQYLIANCP